MHIKDQVLSVFKQQYGTPTLAVRAPGRINLIGEHTDYNHGFVTPAAIDKAMYFCFSPSDEPALNIFAFNLNVRASISLASDFVLRHSWQDYFSAVLAVLHERGLKPANGLNIAFGGDIPNGGGLSSSAALCSGFIFGLNTLFGWPLTRLDMAKIAQLAEHKIGTNCGIMDMFASLFGKANHVIRLDCRDMSYDYFPLELGEYELVLINTKVKHALADSAYNSRRNDCETALAVFQQHESNVQTLRDVDEAMIGKYKNQLTDYQYKRAIFVVQEEVRVRKATAALQANDLVTVGQCMFEAHVGLSQVYEVSCPELDLLVELAKSKTGVLGARMMGGGFGGCTINIIQKSKTVQILEELSAAYEQKFGWKPEPIFVTIQDGVGVVNI